MKRLFVSCLFLAFASSLHAQKLETYKNKKELYGLKDKEGKIIVEPKYTHIARFNEGMAAVNLGGIIEYNAWGEPVAKGGKWGYIDETGKEVIPLKYDAGWTFLEGLVVVKLKGKFGFIDKTGMEVIPFIYDGVYNSGFEGGKARVSLDGRSINIDKTGKRL